jgi:hypothetical protein
MSIKGKTELLGRKNVGKYQLFGQQVGVGCYQVDRTGYCKMSSSGVIMTMP